MVPFSIMVLLFADYISGIYGVLSIIAPTRKSIRLEGEYICIIVGSAFSGKSVRNRGDAVFSFLAPNIDKLREKRDIQGLIKAARYRQNADIREAALQAIMRIFQTRSYGNSEPTPEVFIEIAKQALDDNSMNVRLTAVMALGQARAIDQLGNLVDSPDVSIRLTATKVLVEIQRRNQGEINRLPDEIFIKIYQKELDDPNEQVRLAAIEGLGKAKAAGLLYSLIDSADEDTRLAIVDALSQACGTRELLKVIGDPCLNLRNQALAALIAARKNLDELEPITIALLSHQVKLSPKEVAAVLASVEGTQAKSFRFDIPDGFLELGAAAFTVIQKTASNKFYTERCKSELCRILSNPAAARRIPVSLLKRLASIPDGENTRTEHWVDKDSSAYHSQDSMVQMSAYHEDEVPYTVSYADVRSLAGLELARRH